MEVKHDSNWIDVICVKCQKGFSYNKTFYNNRDFIAPKRCPDCASTARGRDNSASVQRIVVAEFSSILVMVPNCEFKSVERLNRVDLVTGIEYVSCVRSKFFYELDKFLNVYDQRAKNGGEQLEIHNQVVSMRVMEKQDNLSTDIKFQYIVFDRTNESPKCELVIDDTRDAIWSFGRLSAIRKE